MCHSNQRIIKNKVGLLNPAEELGNISKACKVMGFSRETFCRYQHAANEGGVEALPDKSRKKPNLKNRVDEATESAVIAIATDFPAYGQVRAGNELRKQGIFVSPSGVRSIWLRHDLAHFKQRLTALEKKAAEEGLVLTESQVVALERKKDDDPACGEIETAQPGYLGSQDTFYVGTLPTPRWHSPSSILQKPRLPRLICLMIACCRSLKSMAWASFACSLTGERSIVADRSGMIISFI